MDDKRSNLVDVLSSSKAVVENLHDYEFNVSGSESVRMYAIVVNRFGEKGISVEVIRTEELFG